MPIKVMRVQHLILLDLISIKPVISKKPVHSPLIPFMMVLENSLQMQVQMESSPTSFHLNLI